MPIERYGVLKGRAIDARLAGTKPCYQIHITADGKHHRIAVNVRSSASPSGLLYHFETSFRHPILDRLANLPAGFAPLPHRPGGLALDFIRGNLFPPREMRVIPAERDGPDNDLLDLLELYVRRAIAEDEAVVYAFGSRWGPEHGQPDPCFGFEPGSGIRHIHMNQGNAPSFREHDGIWQDGGLFLHLPSQDRWVALLLAFQSQSFHTDDLTGHALARPILPEARPHPPLRIVGLLTNPPPTDGGLETVTLLNASPEAVELAGWQLIDRLGRLTPLSGHLDSGEAVRVALEAGGIRLPDHGGTVTLIDPGGLKVDGVFYTREEARQQGWTLVF